jgi:uncharacterized protein (TIGR04551 family)
LKLAPWVLALVAGCAQFHAAPLPNAPSGETFADIGGVHVHYRERGTGPAVVLIHGYGASLESWAPVMPALTGHRVIAIDLKGFGWTSRPPGDYSPAAQAALVWALLDQLGVGDVAIVGHSWGSSVALSMAVTHPDRVRRIALYDAYVYDDQVPGFFHWAQKGGLGELLFGLFYKERIEDRAPLAYFDERWITQQRIDRVEQDLARPGTTAAALAVIRGHHFAALHDALRGFAKPVLLLWGENDQVTPLRFGQRLAAELSNATLKVYPRCGHIPMVEAQLPSTRDLLAFLDAAPTAASSPASDAGAAGAAPPGSAGAAPTTTRAAPTTTGAAPTTTRGAPATTGAATTTTRGATTGGAAPATGAGAAPTTDAAAADGPAATDITAVPAVTEPQIPVLRAPALATNDALPIGADLAALGAELTPRAYAAARDATEIVVHGALRTRGATLYNFDLDRGLDAAGKPLFPIPLGGGQTLDEADARARTDIAIYARGVGVAVKARIDWLDNVALGGDPDLSNGSPATSPGQRPTTVVVKRVWGEALTPFGVLAVGRMGANFGLGMTANGGDCEDCDHGDAADRIAFVAPLFDHLFAFAYDIASSGPFTKSKDGGRYISLEPSDRAAGPTFAIFHVHSPAALARRAAAGLASFEYGAYVSHRSQDRDVPASYLSTAAPVTTFTSDDLSSRGFTATTTGGWLRLSGTGYRVEAEVAYAAANIAQPSLIPGAALTEAITSSQLGAALESDFALGPAKLGFDAGYASGDSAPGFGAYPGTTASPAGSLEGAQANLPGDHTVDNFRFHPDYHIDQILFREIIGTITDAIYLRPHARTTLLTAGAGRLEAGAALIASWAVDASSTPGGARALGVELDPELRYASRDGFAVTLDYGVLFPGAAFDNPTAHLTARTAQSLRARVVFAF